MRTLAVDLSIVGVLIALLLPAGASKFGRTGTNGYDEMRYGVLVCLLPFVEQGPVYDLFTGSYSVVDAALGNSNTTTLEIEVLDQPENNLTVKVGSPVRESP